HDAIGAAKPCHHWTRGELFIADMGSELWFLLPFISGSITDGGFNVLGNGTTGSSPSRRKRRKIESRKNNELALSTSCSAKPMDKAKAPTQHRSKRPRLQSRPPTTN